MKVTRRRGETITRRLYGRLTSAEVLDEHQVAAAAIPMCEQNATTVRRERQAWPDGKFSLRRAPHMRPAELRQLATTLARRLADPDLIGARAVRLEHDSCAIRRECRALFALGGIESAHGLTFCSARLVEFQRPDTLLREIPREHETPAVAGDVGLDGALPRKRQPFGGRVAMMGAVPWFPDRCYILRRPNSRVKRRIPRSTAGR